MLAKNYSLSSLSKFPKPQLIEAIKALSAEEADAILHDWSLWARPDQLRPTGDWPVWLSLGGRGSGKTRTGAEFIRDSIMNGCKRAALVGPTAADVRDVMVEGDSGILSVCWAGDRDHKGRLMGKPKYEPSKRRLTWENGAIATTYTADKPDRLRGPQHDVAWADECVAWRYPQEAWDMLMFGLRLGDNPRCMVSTTPKPSRFIKGLLIEPGLVMTRASTYDNRANLAASFFRKIIAKYEGTRLGRQELLAELIDDVAGALWTRDIIDQYRVRDMPIMTRIVVAIDPAGSSVEGSDETGIIVAGKGQDGHAYVLEDLTISSSPDVWGRNSVLAYDRYSADRIIGEVNNGGDMVGHVVYSAAKSLFERKTRKSKEVSFKAVRASKGKAVRAEPVAALYEQGKVHHVGEFGYLEDQLCSFTVDFDRAKAGYSPDRLDALVWALTELMLDEVEAPIVSPLTIPSTSRWK